MKKIFIFKYLYSLLIIMLIWSCKADKKPEDVSSEILSSENFETKELEPTRIEPVEIDTSKKVVIIGKSDDPDALEYLNLMNFSHMPFSSYKSPKTVELNDDLLNLTLFDIKSPQLMDLMAFSGKKEIGAYYTRILVSPNDTIKMNIKDGKIKFSGANQAHYNFFIKMDDPLRQDWAIYRQDPFKYKSDLKKSLKKKEGILKNYIKENPEVSKEFKNIVSSELEFQYLYNLILPRIASNSKNARNIIFQEYATQNPTNEKFLNVKDYFKNITIKNFQRPDLINNDYYRRSLMLYIRHLFVNHDYLEYSRRNFLNEKSYIQENLSGEVEAHAISMLINDYYQKGFGHGQQDIDLLIELIKDYKKPFSKPSYAERMNEILSDLEIYNFKLSEIVLNEKLLNSRGDTITLNDIFIKTKAQAKVIDFWATWCRPCISEFKKSTYFKSRISKEENLKFLYFSIDDNFEDWRKKISQLTDYIPTSDNYLIINRKKSKLLKKLLIRESGYGKNNFTIPRYSIVNKDNKMISNNAPRPSDSLIFEKLIKDWKLN